MSWSQYAITNLTPNTVRIGVILLICYTTYYEIRTTTTWRSATILV